MNVVRNRAGSRAIMKRVSASPNAMMSPPPLLEVLFAICRDLRGLRRFRCQSPKRLRHRAKRRRVDGGVLPVPHPHLTEVLPESLGESWHEGRVISESDRTVSDPIVELRRRGGEIRPLALHDGHALL